eukprot:CAMPEP_0178374752 /NCGR_PEP_ID=MMETSP0689_2-20121128/2535_1 /TAXON_ID=160604 /ORGANISM="Amphidinium massartii, Strain CS-259" /LENGTH=123 /DNA_ID=CAMNT_0019994725 /DNA_START=158 /DNA_END=529 /DNA_ORIENTATION=-
MARKSSSPPGPLSESLPRVLSEFLGEINCEHCTLSDAGCAATAVRQAPEDDVTGTCDVDCFFLELPSLARDLMSFDSMPLSARGDGVSLLEGERQWLGLRGCDGFDSIFGSSSLTTAKCKSET